MAEQEKKEDNWEPGLRMRKLTEVANAVQVDPNVPVLRYYRSGVEMVRMADVYCSEGDLENAYILYLRFLSLFLEKIRQHPQYPSVPAVDKASNHNKMKDVMALTETIKQQIAKKYEIDLQAHQLRVQQRREAEAKKAEEEKKAAEEKARKQLQQPEEDQNRWAYNINNVEDSDKAIASEKDLADIFPSSIRAAGNTLEDTISNLTLEVSRPKPVFDRSTKPQNFVAARDKNFSGLRPVVVPADLPSEFIRLSWENTEKNVETCGILAGKLAQGKLWITHLLIPKQSGTADSCTTRNEEDLFAVQDKFGLITLGWIHTHPTQTAFLSSVDLHTHCAYQLMMPEAIAIVCSPKYNETGYFVLTPNYGLNAIASCLQTGFHPHPIEPPLFEVGNHVELDAKAPVTVMDLRK